jgi:hypothetical protein
MRSVCKHWNHSILGWFILRKRLDLSTSTFSCWNSGAKLGKSAKKFFTKPETPTEYEKKLLCDKLLSMIQHEDYHIRFFAIDVLDALEERVVDIAPTLMACANAHWPPYQQQQQQATVVLRPATASSFFHSAAGAGAAGRPSAKPPPVVIRPPLVKTWTRKAGLYSC